MQLAFVLSMPGNNSWNGRWSGDGKLFAIIKTFTGKKREAKARELIEKRSFGYDFGDGWYARVDVRELKPGESRQIRKNSKGFWSFPYLCQHLVRKRFNAC